MQQERKVIMYIAMSLDGKIAKPDGDVKWLEEMPNPDHSDFGYIDFYNSTDVTLMGRATYDFVLNSGVPFPYTTTKNFVFTKNQQLEDNHDVKFIRENPADFVRTLKQEPGKNIWLVGGGKLNTSLLNEGMVDEMMVFVMPIILGDGIPLFGEFPKQTSLKLLHSINYSSGASCLVYKLNK